MLVRALSGGGGGAQIWSQYYSSASSIPSTITLDFEPKYVFIGISWQNQNALYESWTKDGGGNDVYERYFLATKDSENSANLSVSGNQISFGANKQYMSRTTITAIGGDIEVTN